MVNYLSTKIKTEKSIKASKMGSSLKPPITRKNPFLLGLSISIVAISIIAFFWYLHETQWMYKEYILPLIYIGIFIFLCVVGFVYLDRSVSSD